jgi:AraC-like DNA-binding protein
MLSAPAWNITVPSGPRRLAGVTMAAFGDQTPVLLDVEMVPHPSVMIILNLGEQAVVVDDGSGGVARQRIVAGLAPQGVRGQGSAGNFQCLQVRLSPVVAYAVLGAAPELTGAVRALEDLWGPDAVRIEERLRAARTWDERFVIAETAVARRYDAGRAVDPEVAFCWERIGASRGRARVEQLAAEAGWSRKRLWSRFRAQVGLTPKRAAQLVRFDYAAHRLAAGHSPAAVAAESGYADQSHLHRDVMAFTGVTPTSIATAPFLSPDDVAWAAA